MHPVSKKTTVKHLQKAWKTMIKKLQYSINVLIYLFYFTNRLAYLYLPADLVNFVGQAEAMWSPCLFLLFTDVSEPIWILLLWKFRNG